MPCTFCHNISHTLSKCPADIRPFIQQFRQLVAVNPYALKQQYLFLNQYSKPVLTLICKKVRLISKGNKFEIVGKIVKKYFEHFASLLEINTNNGIEANDAEIFMNQIDRSYNELYTWSMPNNLGLQAWCLEMRQKLDTHHTILFGTSITLTRFLRFSQTHLLPQIDPKAHLQHLQINVTVDAVLTMQECFMCCDENKNLAALGCGHSYCTDCVVNTAVSRTKSVIKCAICREDVAEIKVGTEDLRAAVVARLAEE
jgi:hypothetical protein